MSGSFAERPPGAEFHLLLVVHLALLGMLKMDPTVLGLFVLGLVLLAAGAVLLVRGAARLAARFGISPLVIGLTVVAFGTSAPEMAVSVQAGLAGQADIAVGNMVGSNIFNVLFILGVSALIVPLVVSGATGAARCAAHDRGVGVAAGDGARRPHQQARRPAAFCRHRGLYGVRHPPRPPGNIFNILAIAGIAAVVAPGGLAVAPALLRFDIPVMIAVALACLPIFASGHLPLTVVTLIVLLVRHRARTAEGAS